MQDGIVSELRDELIAVARRQLLPYMGEPLDYYEGFSAGLDLAGALPSASDFARREADLRREIALLPEDAPPAMAAYLRGALAAISEIGAQVAGLESALNFRPEEDFELPKEET